MLTAFWSSISGKLADRFVALSAPALVFWLGGLLAWSYGHGGIQALNEPASWLSGKSTLTQAVALLIVIFGVSASGLVISRLTTPVLRLLEGYWPTRPARLTRMRNALIAKSQKKITAEDKEWQPLIEQIQGPATPTSQQLASIARIARSRHRRPDQPNLVMPTRIGNILRAAETRPRGRYGLDAVATWPQLWLVLPDSTRQELVSARQALDGSVAASIWGVLFCVFTPWTLAALPIGLAVSAIAVILWVPARAEMFGDLVDATYDMHRTALYQQLRWPLPTDPKDELVQGKLITTYLQVGSDDSTPTFITPS